MSELVKDFASAYYVEPITRSLKFSETRHGDPNILKNGFYLPFRKYGLDALEAISKKIMFRTLDIKKAANRLNVAILSNCYLEHFVPKSLFDIIAYDCLDAIEVHAHEFEYEKYKQLHRDVVEKSDLVFVTADKLREEIKSIDNGKQIVTVSNGVNRKYFERQKDQCNVDKYLPRGRKIVGYVGAIYEWIDLELVMETALRLPQYDFVMVGPVKESFHELVKKKPNNMVFLGAQEYKTIPAYINNFDICLIPFKNTDIADSTDPIKLYEYFSIGKPVVATNMHQLKRYNDNKLLKIAVDSGQFAEAIEQFSLKDNDEWREARRRIAENNSWEKKAKIMIGAIERAARTVI
jgi:hypothetical protein